MVPSSEPELPMVQPTSPLPIALRDPVVEYGVREQPASGKASKVPEVAVDSLEALS